MLSEYISQISDKEREVIKILAEEGPKCGYDFHLGGSRKRGARKALMSNSHWNYIKKHLGPEELNLIKNIKLRGRPERTSKRRRHPYWLTDKGIVAAALSDARLTSLLANVKKYRSHDKESALILELIELTDIGKELLALAYSTMQTTNVNLNLRTILGLAVTKAIRLSKNQRNELFSNIENVLKKYPKYHAMFKREMKEAVKDLTNFALLKKWQ